ncbi:RND transporter MFP subunit [Hypericibacter adhaerens]|uniref:RND transporter MFP subunit n=2 Tax=Hypericibacter adhaerens TaxID=2602016 RepID=A0A5J6N1C3_9PROT|nr:RND transporter MFP subunit [Hypericibacter adhaerens]
MRYVPGLTSQNRIRALLRSLPLMGVVLLAACGEKEQAQQAPAAPPAVGVMAVAMKAINPTAGFTGRVQAVDKVDVLARINGFLDKRLFTEGQHVNVGDQLFVIEQPPYQAQLDQKQAELESAMAAQKNTAVQLQRAIQLVKTNNIPQATLDQRQAEDTMAKSVILEAQAALEQAQINFAYTSIKAPIAGRIGQSTFTVGSYVTPQSGTLATIVSQDPIYVTFPVAQRIVTEYRRKNPEPRATDKIAVKLQLADGSEYDHVGKIDFVDVEVDRGTDTVLVRASFDNPDGVLVDGQFVNVSIELGESQMGISIPQTAIQLDQAGAYVFVVTSDNKVELRRIKTQTGASGESTVLEGLKEGEKIVVDGIQKVRPGQPVTPTDVQPAIKS